ncbi:hypothetical protein Tco_0598287 [Tanacetum coccineum]
MEESILERNRENLHFKLSWMLLLSLHAILHFSPPFRMDKKKKFGLNLEIFRDIFQISPRVHGQNFDKLLTDEDIVSFFKELGHTGEIKTITDIVVDQMHQPWRTFATIINRSLFGKTTGLDKIFSPEEPTRKSKRVKKPSKKSTNTPTRGVVIRETPVMSLSKKKPNSCKPSFDRLADKQSGRPSGSLPSNIQPNPKGHNSKAYQPPQSRDEHVNVVFTRSGKSYKPPVNLNDQQNDSETPINFDSDDEEDEPTP